MELALRALDPHVDEVVVAVPPGSLATWPARQGVTYVEGGETRQSSVRAMLEATTADHVLVHDVARPFLPAEVVLRARRAARTHGAASAALGGADPVVTSDRRRLGGHVELVEGSPLLMKVTRPEDLLLAEALLALRGATSR